MSKVITLTRDQVASAQVLMGPEALDKLRRMDSSTVHPYRWLTKIEQEVVSQDFTPNDGLVLAPVDTNLGLWEQEIEITVREKGGQAKYLDSESSEKDVPLLSAKDKPIPFTVHEAFVGYKVNRAEMAMPSDRVRRSTAEQDADCVEALETLADSSLVRKKQKESGVVGFADYAALKSSNSNYLINDDSNPLDDLKFLNRVLRAIQTENKSAIRPDTLAMTSDQRDIISTKLVGDTGRTVLSFLVENSKFLASPDAVLGLESLRGAGPKSEDLLIPYKRDKRIVCVYMHGPARYAILKTLKGELVVWIMRHSDVIWKKPLGGHVYKMAAKASA